MGFKLRNICFGALSFFQFQKKYLVLFSPCSCHLVLHLMMTPRGSVLDDLIQLRSEPI